MPRQNGCQQCYRRPKVAIIGAGLVGSLAAIQFGINGYETDVYEYRDDIRTTTEVFGRSIALELCERGRAALREVGLEEMLAKRCIPMIGRMFFDHKGNKKECLYDKNKSKIVYSVNRKFLNEILLTAAENTPNVNIFFNHKLIESNLKDGKLQFIHTVKHKIINRTADLIIGADGAFSTIRKQMMREPGFTFQQTYIDHGYIELKIPQDIDGTSKLDEKYNYLWYGEKCMMNVLPNPDHSWAITLVMSFEEFNKIKCETDLLDFFQHNFPGLIELIEEENLIKQFFKTKQPNFLLQVICKPYDAFERVLLIGDAAHAMLPFYGQGTNSGLEDVTLLFEMLKRYDDNIPLVLKEFSKIRLADTHAVSNATMYDYNKLNSNNELFWYNLRKEFDEFMFKQFGDNWLPLFNAFTFTQWSYRECIEYRKKQDRILKGVAFFIGLVIMLFPYVYIFLNRT